MEEDTGKSLHVGGATGRIHGADYSLVDYNRAGIPLIEIVTKPIAGAREQAPEVARAYVAPAARPAARARRLRRADGAGLAALRRQPVAGAAPARRPARHPHRDQERQLAALGRAGRPVRDHPPGGGPGRRAGRSCRRPGTGTRTPGSPRSGREKADAEDYRYFPEPDLVPIAPDPRVGRGAARRAARASRASAGRGCRPSGASPTWRCATWSTPARSTWSRRPSPPGPRPRRPASGGSASWPAGPTSAASSSPSCRSPRPRSPAVQALVDAGALNDKLARQVVDGVLAGEGDAGRGRRRARAGGRLRRRRARCGRRPGDRGQPGRRREDPRRQGRRGRRARRRRDEGDARPGRRRAGPRADPGAPLLGGGTGRGGRQAYATRGGRAASVSERPSRPGG